MLVPLVASQVVGVGLPSATPEAFDRDSDTVQRFYDARRRAAVLAEPNPAHDALARLERELGDDLLVVTQNVDDLHACRSPPNS